MSAARRSAIARVLRWSALGALGSIAAVSCAFPEVTFGPGDDGGVHPDGSSTSGSSSSSTSSSSSSSTSSGGTSSSSTSSGSSGTSSGGTSSGDLDATADADAASDAPSEAAPEDAAIEAAPDASTGEPDAGPPDTGPPDTGPPLPDAQGCCDCDDDGYPDKTRQGCNNAPGLQDCDDSDPRAHPNQGFLSDSPTAKTNGDWDCSGQPAQKETIENITCSSYLTATTSCPTISGFTATVGCGQAGTWVRCKKAGALDLTCSIDPAFTINNKTQQCK